MSTRVEKGGPKFKPILKSKARPSTTPVPQDGRIRSSADASASMPPPFNIPERTPSVAPVPRAASTTPTPSSNNIPATRSVLPPATEIQPPRTIDIQYSKPQNTGSVISPPSARRQSSGTPIQPSRVSSAVVRSSIGGTAIALPSARPSVPATPVASTSSNPSEDTTISPSRGEPIPVSRPTPPSSPVSSRTPLSTSKGKKRAVSEAQDADTTDDGHPIQAQSVDGRGGVARKRPKLSIVQAEADRVKRPRRAKAKKTIVVSEAEEDTAGEGTSEIEGVKKKTRAIRKKATDENATEDSTGGPSRPKRPRARRKQTQDADTSTQEAPDASDSRSESEAPTKKKRRRRATTTPAEQPEGTPEPIDPTQVTMGTICDDPGSGRVSSRWETSRVQYEEARKRAKEERTRAILEAQEEERETGRTSARKGMPKPVLPSEQDVVAGEESVVENMGGNPDEFTYDESLKASHYAPQVRIGANGEVVLDMDSLQVDRAADPEITEEAYSFVEESDQSKFTNSSSWSKRRNVRWGKEDTALFYDALRQFGQNYDLIARVLPGRTYKMCKNKFKAEDKKNPGLIDDALKNGVAVDLNALSRLTGKDFSGPTPVIEAKKALDLREDEDMPAERAATNDIDEIGGSEIPGLHSGENAIDKESDIRQSPSPSPPPPHSLLSTISTTRQSASPPPPEALLNSIVRSSSGPHDGPVSVATPSRATVPVAISAPTRQSLARAAPATTSTNPVQNSAEPSGPQRKKGKKKAAAQEEGVEVLGLVDDHVED